MPPLSSMHCTWLAVVVRSHPCDASPSAYVLLRVGGGDHRLAQPKLSIERIEVNFSFEFEEFYNAYCSEDPLFFDGQDKERTKNELSMVQDQSSGVNHEVQLIVDAESNASNTLNSGYRGYNNDCPELPNNMENDKREKTSTSTKQSLVAASPLTNESPGVLSKEEIRRKYNQKSAQLSRERKKARVNELEATEKLFNEVKPLLLKILKTDTGNIMSEAILLREQLKDLIFKNQYAASAFEISASPGFNHIERIPSFDLDEILNALSSEEPRDCDGQDKERTKNELSMVQDQSLVKNYEELPFDDASILDIGSKGCAPEDCPELPNNMENDKPEKTSTSTKQSLVAASPLTNESPGVLSKEEIRRLSNLEAQRRCRARQETRVNELEATEKLFNEVKPFLRKILTADTGNIMYEAMLLLRKHLEDLIAKKQYAAIAFGLPTSHGLNQTGQVAGAKMRRSPSMVRVGSCERLHKRRSRLQN